MYAAFGRGDVPAILDCLADDVHWEQWEDNSAQKAGVPTMIGGTGKAAVASFFAEVGRMQIAEFRVLDLMTSERQVAAEVFIDTIASSGRRYRDEEVHLWTFDDAGKVTRFRHYIDTAKHMRAANKE
ncbi:MAG: nuclear transport factor 2 family protein [Vicinamibacterales bacterium]